MCCTSRRLGKVSLEKEKAYAQFIKAEADIQEVQTRAQRLSTQLESEKSLGEAQLVAHQTLRNTLEESGRSLEMKLEQSENL